MKEPQDIELEDIPRDSYELIDILDKLFPHRSVFPGQSYEDALFYGGRRQLIDELVELKREELERVAEESAEDDAGDPMGRRLLKPGGEKH